MVNSLLKNLLLGLVVVVLIALGSSIYATNATTNFYYEPIELGTFGISSISRINDVGQVVSQRYLWENGTLTDLSNASSQNRANANVSQSSRNLSNVARKAHLLVSHSTTSMTNLEKPNAPATAIFPVSTRGLNALAINDSSQVTGYSAVQVDGYARYRGFVWQNGSITSLGTLGGDLESAALDINDKGKIVGYSGSVTLSNNPTRAVLWNSGRLTNLAGTNSKAYAINNRGQIVGSYTRNGAKRAFKWENRTMINLGTLRGYNNSEAYDINNKGQVVGYSYRSDSSGLGPYHAFKWDNGILTDLGTLGGNYSIAHSINNAGKVVGSSLTGNGSYHAFVWNQGRMRNLNDLLPANSGWELNSAQDINNNGQIVGYGKFNGQSRSFLLTPITVIN